MPEHPRFWALRAPLVCGIAMLSGCAGHRGPPPSTDIEEAGLREHVRVLASDDFEGRRPGSHGEEKTVAYLVDQFRKLGLKPGNGDSYLQQVPLVEITAQPGASLAVGSPAGMQQLAYGKDMVIWTKRETAQSALHGSAVVFVGYGIVAPEYEWNDYANIDVRGKTVLVLVNDPGYGSQDPQIFKGNVMTHYGRWPYKVEEAARQGAAGVLLIHDTRAAAYGWNLVVGGWTGPQLDLAAPDGNAGRAAIEGWVSADAARALFARAGLDFTAQSAAASRPGFKAVETGLTADASVQNDIQHLTSANVIAVLPGAKRKHEYVMYTAHWDSLGRAGTAGGGAAGGPAAAPAGVPAGVATAVPAAVPIFSGAVDDASGVGGLLELAQSFSRTQPKSDRSIAFAAFTGGASGLLGSAYYVEHPVLSLRDTAGVLNLDALHIGGPTRDVMIIGFGNSELEDYLRAAALLQGREVHPEPNPEQGLYFRSDQFNFARFGVPSLYAKAGIDDSARGPNFGRAQIDDYMAHRYRQPSDKYSPDWDVRGAIDDLTLYYEVGNRLARSRRFPRWYPNSEFRSLHKPDHGPGVQPSGAD